ncbi:hypothetical protein J6590_069079 [Homalodisca vitripennis]|nr:hypothetical protein J6590_069079 [Homalodisca vitripennis]
MCRPSRRPPLLCYIKKTILAKFLYPRCQYCLRIESSSFRGADDHSVFYMNGDFSQHETNHWWAFNLTYSSLHRYHHIIKGYAPPNGEHPIFLLLANWSAPPSSLALKVLRPAETILATFVLL